MLVLSLGEKKKNERERGGGNEQKIEVSCCLEIKGKVNVWKLLQKINEQKNLLC